MSVIKKLSSEPVVAFHVAYAKLPGSDAMCALFLSQVSYWCSKKEDGVAWITHQAMYDQTGMTRKQQDRAAAYWVAQGVMSKFIKGIPPKIHYFIDFAKLDQLVLDAEFQQNDVSERDNLVARKGQQVLSERGKTSIQDSEEIQTTEQQPAAPSPSAPESEKTLKPRSIAGMEREVSLKEKLLEVWNASCSRAKAKTGRSLPSCLKFPVDAGPSLKRYMKAYSDDEILQLVTDGSFRVQRNNFWHERKYSLTNLMRNLEANASLPEATTARPAEDKAISPTPTDHWLAATACPENDDSAQSGRGMDFANDDWMKA